MYSQTFWSASEFYCIIAALSGMLNPGPCQSQAHHCLRLAFVKLFSSLKNPVLLDFFGMLSRLRTVSSGLLCIGGFELGMVG